MSLRWHASLIKLMNILKCVLLIAVVVLSPKLSFAEKVFFFEGDVNFVEKEFEILFKLGDEGSVSIQAKKASEKEYRFKLDVGHVKALVFDIVSKMEGVLQVVESKGSSKNSLKGPLLSGRVWSQYSLVDYKPVEELSGRFEVKNQRLHLTEVLFGSLQCRGYIDMVSPYNMDLVLNLVDIDMKDFLNIWSSKKKYDSSGAVSGDIYISGTPSNLALKGSLASFNGFVGKLDFDTFFLNIEGIYPHMQISKSTVSKSDGVSFMLDGPFDLSGRNNFKKQIKALTIAPLVHDSGSEREWTIKRLNLEDSGVTELKYRFRKGDALEIGTSAGYETDMLGLEQTRKF